MAKQSALGIDPDTIAISDTAESFTSVTTDTISGSAVATAKALWAATTTGNIATGSALTTGNLNLGGSGMTAGATTVYGGTGFSGIALTPGATGGIDFTTGNITYVPIGGDIETYIANATAGDTLVLASGTYTIPNAIDVSKAINVVGQGIGKTILYYSGATIVLLNITSSNVSFSRLSLDITTTTGTSYGFYAVGTGGSVLTNVNIDTVLVTMTGDAGACVPIHYTDAGGIVRNTRVICNTATANAYGVYNVSSSTAEAVASVTCYNVDCQTYTSGAASRSYAFYTVDNGTNNDVILNLYNCRGTATGAATVVYGAITYAGSNALINAENCILSGTTYDVGRVSSGGLITLRNCVLPHNLTNGTITYDGYTSSGNGIIVNRHVLADGVDNTKNRKISLGITTPPTGARMIFQNSATAISAAMTISTDNGTTDKNVLKASDNTTAVTAVAASATIECYFDGTQWLLLTQ